MILTMATVGTILLVVGVDIEEMIGQEGDQNASSVDVWAILLVNALQWLELVLVVVGLVLVVVEVVRVADFLHSLGLMAVAVALVALVIVMEPIVMKTDMTWGGMEIGIELIARMTCMTIVVVMKMKGSFLLGIVFQMADTWTEFLIMDLKKKVIITGTEVQEVLETDMEVVGQPVLTEEVTGTEWVLMTGLGERVNHLMLVTRCFCK